MSRKKVLFCECGRAGGSIKRLVNLLKNINLSKYKPAVLSFYEDWKAKELVEFKSRFPVFSLGIKESPAPDPIKALGPIKFPSLFFFRYLLKALFIFSVTRPDVVYINNTPFSHLPVMIISRLLRKKMICHLRDTVLLTNAELRCLKWVTKIVVLSKSHVKYYANQGISIEKLVVVYNGINLEEFDKQAQDTPNIVQDENIIAFVATLYERKRWRDVIEAASILREQISNFLILILGDGVERRNLEAEIKDRNLGDFIQILGYVSSVAPYLKCSKLGLMVSDREGMPNVILEYMAAGLPVIATSLPGVDEMVINGTNGSLIPPQRPDLLAKAIKDLLLDEAMRRRMGEASRRILESGKFTVKDEIHAIEDIIANV